MNAAADALAPLCERCGELFAQRGSTLCGRCRKGTDTTTNDKPQTTNDKREAEGSNVYELPPLLAPVVCGGIEDEEEEKEMYRLIRLYEQGSLEPVDVHLVAPPGAGRLARAIVAHLRVTYGLRLANGHDPAFPLPYGITFAIDYGRLPTKDRGSVGKAICGLARFGTIEHVGELPPRGKPNGLKLYRLPAAEVERLRMAA